MLEMKSQVRTDLLSESDASFDNDVNAQSARSVPISASITTPVLSHKVKSMEAKRELLPRPKPKVMPKQMPRKRRRQPPNLPPRLGLLLQSGCPDLAGRGERDRPPCSFAIGTAHLWVCGQSDVEDVALLRAFESFPLVVTCKSALEDHVTNACRRASNTARAGDPILFNVGYAPHRGRRFFGTMDRIKFWLDGGSDVILHCRKGIHRAAHTFCVAWMYLTGCTYNESRQLLESKRDVDLDSILEATQRRDGTWTEAHKLYIPAWENEAKTLQRFRIAGGFETFQTRSRSRLETPEPATAAEQALDAHLERYFTASPGAEDDRMSATNVVTELLDATTVVVSVDESDNGQPGNDNSLNGDADRALLTESASESADPNCNLFNAALADATAEDFRSGKKRDCILITVGGPSGVGKSTLVDELVKHYGSPLLEIHDSAFYVHNSQCPILQRWSHELPGLSAGLVAPRGHELGFAQIQSS